MVTEANFKVGSTYFAIYYMDEKLKLPIVETLVYLGPDTVDEDAGPEPGHLFQHADSFYADGNWNDLTEAERYEFEEPPVIAFSDKHRDNVVDANGLIAELKEWQARNEVAAF
jgi:hypothetical protein